MSHLLRIKWLPRGGALTVKFSIEVSTLFPYCELHIHIFPHNNGISLALLDLSLFPSPLRKKIMGDRDQSWAGFCRVSTEHKGKEPSVPALVALLLSPMCSLSVQEHTSGELRFLSSDRSRAAQYLRAVLTSFIKSWNGKNHNYQRQRELVCCDYRNCIEWVAVFVF